MKRTFERDRANSAWPVRVRNYEVGAKEAQAFAGALRRLDDQEARAMTRAS